MQGKSGRQARKDYVNSSLSKFLRGEDPKTGPEELTGGGHAMNPRDYPPFRSINGVLGSGCLSFP